MFRYSGIYARLLVAAVILLLCSPAYAVAKESKDALQFDIMVAQGAERYLELLEYPAYLAVALENNGIKPSGHLGRALLIDESSIQFKNAKLRYIGKSGFVYKYKFNLEWGAIFELPMEVDTSLMLKGHMLVRVYIPMARLFPDVLVERIRTKIQILSGPDVQKKMLTYLDDLANKNTNAHKLEGIFSQIMMQSYNSPVGIGDSAECAIREPGDAESLSDQAYLLVTLAIWLIVVPLAAASYYGWKRFKGHKTRKPAS